MYQFQKDCWIKCGPIPKVLSIKIHTSTSISLSPIKTLPYVFSPGPIHPGSHFLVIFKGAKMGFMNMYTYYISHFFFTRDKVECYYTLLSHFYVVLVCRRAEWHFTAQIMVWSHCKNKTSGGPRDYWFITY